MLAVVDGFMGIVRLEIGISSGLISSDQRNFLIYGFSRERIKRSLVSIFYHLANDVTLPADCADDSNLASRTATFCFLVPVVILFSRQ